jgi:hypothetical protein
MNDLAFDAFGTLYGWNGGFGGAGNAFGGSDLYTIDLATGAATLVGNFGPFTSGNGLAFTSDGTLFLDPRCNPALSTPTGCAGSFAGIVTIDPSTGLQVSTLPLVGVPPDQFFNAMDFDPDTGLLFGISRFLPFWALMSIDPVTGQVTQIGPEQFVNIFGSTGISVDTCPVFRRRTESLS